MGRGRPTGKRKMKLSTWAKREGIPIRTAQRRFHEGSLPVPTFVTDTGRLMVLVEDPHPALSAEEVTEMLFAIKSQLNRIERALQAR